jgi:glycerol uptake facilitator-like aquaporin
VHGSTTTFAGIAFKHVPGFVVAQLIGATLAALTARILFKSGAQDSVAIALDQ